VFCCDSLCILKYLLNNTSVSSICLLIFSQVMMLFLLIDSVLYAESIDVVSRVFLSTDVQ
jgi:hypothetical protein